MEYQTDVNQVIEKLQNKLSEEILKNTILEVRYQNTVRELAALRQRLEEETSVAPPVAVGVEEFDD